MYQCLVQGSLELGVERGCPRRTRLLHASSRRPIRAIRLWTCRVDPGASIPHVHGAGSATPPRSSLHFQRQLVRSVKATAASSRPKKVGWIITFDHYDSDCLPVRLTFPRTFVKPGANVLGSGAASSVRRARRWRAARRRTTKRSATSWGTSLVSSYDVATRISRVVPSRPRAAREEKEMRMRFPRPTRHGIRGRT